MIAPASRKIGKYEIRHKLGRGGMADVYLAQETDTSNLVALKLIEHSDDADTRDSIEAERRGAELQQRLAAIDPRVVRLYSWGDLDGYFFVAMEYVDGQDLAEWMGGGPLMPEFATDTAMAVAQTLEHAHALQVSIDGKDFHGIVHGDIKPKNIRIDAHGEVRVLDFGIAKALSLSRRLTRNDFGSVPYASPERLDTGEVSVSSDLWSLAVMLHEMVTGLQPYHAETTEKLERMIRSRIPPPPAPDPCPEPMRRILIKALAPEPELRYPSASEMLADLSAFRAGEPVRAATEDLEATRRTHRGEPDEETRRTARAEEPSEETRRTTDGSSAATAQQPVKPAAPRKVFPVAVKRGMLAASLGLLAYLGLWGGSNYLTYRRGLQLVNDIETEQVTDPNTIWNLWTELSKGNPSSMLLRGPRKAVKQKLLAAADHVFDSYRNSDAVYENQWKYARDMSAHALALEPGDAVRGRLRLAEGHLARINGTTHRNAAELSQSVAKFSEAQQLMPDSPDPQLGLAKVYVSGLKDIDKANEAFRQAEKRGFPLGKREKAQLADAYRDRADRMSADARTVRGLPQEKNYIERARDDYQHALELYQDIAPYGNASASVVRVQKSLESVNSRLQDLEHSGMSGFLWRLWH